VGTYTIIRAKNTLIPVPSASEQKRIVKILDEVFEKTEKAKVNAQKNLQNTKDLFESNLQKAFTKKDNTWITKTIDDCVAEGILFKPLDGNHGEIHPKKQDFVLKGVPFIMACDIKDGLVDEEHCKFINEKQAQNLRTGFAENDDVLLSHKGTIGRVGILKTDNKYDVLTPQVTFYRIRDSKKLLNKYIYYYFLTPKFQRELNDIANGGSTRAYIGITKQLTLSIPIAPIIEQQSIVSQLDLLAKGTNKLKKIYPQKLNELEGLKKSILNQAFSGNL
jgi:type I restriction enzyme S subunit